jgi:hypothetical protein
MISEQAKEIGRQWVMAEAAALPGFYGAFFHGSINDLPADAVLPATSDVDVMVVLDDPDLSARPGKFFYRGVLLEVSYLSRDGLKTPESVLSNYRMAGSFRRPGVILDPSGQLARLQEAVARGFAQRAWVARRCEDACNNVLAHLRSLAGAKLFHDQAACWLFAAGVTTHVLLAAGMKNPTVRRRYLAARELLAEYHRLDFYEPLLELPGFARIDRQQVELHLAALSAAFDAAATVIKTPFAFAADISEIARPIAIDGSRELIECGYHREALFWIVATYSRCQQVFTHDASPEVQAEFGVGYRRLLASLGIASPEDIQERAEQVRRFLPRVREVAAEIMTANAEIEDV